MKCKVKNELKTEKTLRHRTNVVLRNNNQIKYDIFYRMVESL